MSFLQTGILILASFAFSYLIFDSFKSVEAAGFGEGCCEESDNGYCKMTSSSECTEDWVPTECVNAGFCELGCCISENDGICNERSYKADCEKRGGIFKPTGQNGYCEGVSECEKGCCILGDQAKWTTEQNCMFESNLEHRKDLKKEFIFDENHDTFLECLFSVDKDKTGGCVFDSDGETKCAFVTLEECVSRTGSESNFAQDVFCSDPSLNTTCVAHNSTGCVDKEEDIYWFDSCGNREGVVGGEGGEGDCDLYRGTYCIEKNGKASCRKVDCDLDGDGNYDRKNGESWCTYDGIIGNGKDPAGSRHVKHVCFMGTERLQACADYRNEICVQDETSTDEGSFSQAACRINQWRTCFDYNNKVKRGGTEGMESKCKDNPDCKIVSIDMAKPSGDFKFKVCVPNYPPGFELNTEQNILNEDGTLNEEQYYSAGASAADGICGQASATCTSTWLIGIFCPGCVANCDCHKPRFTKEMNDLCLNLGDCGGYINYVGQYTDGGYSVGGEEAPGRLKGPSFPNTYGGTPAEPGSKKFFEAFYVNPENLPEKFSKSNLSGFEQELLTAAGAYGSVLLLKILTDDVTNPGDIAGGLGEISGSNMMYSRYTGSVSSLQASISAQRSLLTKEDPQPQDFSMIASMIASAVIYALTQSIIASVIAGILAMLLFMPCIVIHKTVYFDCLPWEPPTGGGSCGKCNSVDVPCTDYRCESLGSACQLINKGTGEEMCVAREADESMPIISPFESALTEGLKYKKSDNGFELVDADSDGCIEPYTSVQIGIKVEPWAKCRWSNNSRDEYEDMGEYFGPKGHYLLPAHVTRLFFPNPEAFKDPTFKARFMKKNNLTDDSQVDFDAIARELGDWQFFVKCKTLMGKVNPTPYSISTCIRPGPDLTAPRVVRVIPDKGSYIPYGINEKKITMYVNEPSECKWSVSDKEYDNMDNLIQCEENPLSFTNFGYKCESTLTGLSNNTKFYIRCRDLTENSNTMSESYVYELKISLSTLNIEEIIPKEGFKKISGSEPVSINLRLRTSGGANEGEAVCRWEENRENGFSDLFRYQNTNGSSTHEYQLSRLGGGEYSINFFCEDVAGNTAENSTRFAIEIDKYGPKIVRVYYDYGLKIFTSEDAKECRYSYIRNSLNVNDTIEMYGSGREFSAPWNLKTLYIQCEDEYGNKGNKLSVKPTG